MAETAKACVAVLTPIAHVAGVQRSVNFYNLFGLEVRGSLRNPSGELQWVHLACETAELMLTRATRPVVASQQGVSFYLYSPGLIALREHLVANGVKVSPIAYPSYMPKGEIQVDDPDGYSLQIGQGG